MDPRSPEPLDPETVDPDPLVQFRALVRRSAFAAGVRQPEAMTLATVADRRRRPMRAPCCCAVSTSVGFAFYTNLESAKAEQLAADPTRRARVPLARGRTAGAGDRVRSRGSPIDDATRYWEQRPRGHRAECVGVAAERGGGRRPRSRHGSRRSRRGSRPTDPPLPPFWGGYVVGARARSSCGRAARTGCTTACATDRETAPACGSANGSHREPDGGRGVGRHGPLRGRRLVEPRRATTSRLEYVCKPATLTALIVVAVALDPATGAGDRRAWFVAALVFSLAGDVFLMLPRDAFVRRAGRVSRRARVLRHRLLDRPPSAAAMVIASVVVVLAVAPIAHRVLRALGDEPALRPPVAVYMVVISAMVASAIASGQRRCRGRRGALRGIDSLIAWDRFVRPARVGGSGDHGDVSRRPDPARAVGS